MTKAVIRAIDPITGEVFARETARMYHAAIVATSPATGLVEVLAWCGRPDLALSQLDKAIRGTLNHWRDPRPDARLAIVEKVLGKAPAVKPAARPVLPGEATPPPAPSHGPAAPRLPEVSTSRPLHPMAEMLLMRLAATDSPCLAVERLPIWDALAESGWIEITRVVRTQKGEWCECCITGLGRSILDARPPV